MALLSAADWALYKDTINEASDTFNKKPVTWRKTIYKLDRFGEDGDRQYDDIILEGLFLNNYFRSWPLTKTMDTGELDKESTVLILNQKYLKDNGYLNSKDFFQFSPGDDRFIVDGEFYKAFGDVKISQANDEELLYIIVLKREETPTGENVYE